MLRVAILGRPNVGKSSLFNRLCKRSLAIVNAQEGTTRDRLYGEIQLFNTPVQVIDTGGIDKDSADHFQKHIYQQAMVAAHEADFLLLVVDIRCGITEQDAHLARQLLPLKKPLILIANKADTFRDEQSVHAFHNLGIAEIIPTSATHDRHIDHLLERIRVLADLSVIETIEEESIETDYNDTIELSEEDLEILSEGELELLESLHKRKLRSSGPLKIALIGRPNVGKSSIINGLLNEERCITDTIPGTTRDNIDVLYTYDNQDYLFIDTAGLRKTKSIKNSTEWISSSRTEKAISRADICLLVVDATQGLSSYDKRILTLIVKHKKPYILLINKWDLIFGIRMEHYIQDLRATDPYIGQARILCISATTKRGLSRIFSSINQLYAIVSRKISTPQLNKILASAMQKHHPQVINNRRLRIYYGIHKTNTPFQFLLFINAKILLTKHYELYLKNALKSAFDLYGIPFELEYKEKEKRFAKK